MNEYSAMLLSSVIFFFFGEIAHLFKILCEKNKNLILTLSHHLCKDGLHVLYTFSSCNQVILNLSNNKQDY